MSTFDKIAARLLAEHDIVVTDLHRCYHGYWQRAAGAWSWCGRYGSMDIGSQFPASEILKAKKWTVSKTLGGYDIDPEQ